MRALSHRNDTPQTASRPFDATRDGFVAAEGGALLVLEELDFAMQRGAQPLAEVLAYAASSDAIHLTAPDDHGAGMAHCIRKALQRAGVRPEEIAYINAHGTGTPIGDPAEARAIKGAMGGAGSMEAVICVMAMRSGCIPPTINLHTPDPECDLDWVPNTARSGEMKIVLSNSLGFGGHNTTLVFKAFP
jgi:3-oxoacyl-(acyl-carrier-protein) synthase